MKVHIISCIKLISSWPFCSLWRIILMEMWHLFHQKWLPVSSTLGKTESLYSTHTSNVIFKKLILMLTAAVSYVPHQNKSKQLQAPAHIHTKQLKYLRAFFLKNLICSRSSKFLGFVLRSLTALQTTKPFSHLDRHWLYSPSAVRLFDIELFMHIYKFIRDSLQQELVAFSRSKPKPLHFHGTFYWK